jgi:asparagine synthase (glutamine-hydrolysing)
MGGICGIQYLKSEIETDDRITSNMLDSIKHRGEKVKIFSTGAKGTLGVGCPESKSETQWFACDIDRKLSVILDGEIFHISDENIVQDTPFSDADVILDLYSRHADKFADKIDGSYAVAIWDGLQEKLLLIRDRLGSKPLYYYNHSNLVVFGSEIKAILASNIARKSVNFRSLNNFLSFGYVPNPATMFESIQQVRPAHIMTFTATQILEEPYWKFAYVRHAESRPESYYFDRFFDIFKRSVSRRLKRYPDCGAFLSGGLDTSAVVAVMRQEKQGPFKVFTAGFEEEQYNEIGDAKIVSDHVNVEQLDVIVKVNEEFPELLEKIVWHHDSPFSDTSAIPSYFAAELARRNVNVVLTGDFPDQLIGGSGHHAVALSRLESDSPIYRLLRNRSLNRLATRIPWSASGTSLRDRAKRILYRETFPLEEQRIILNMPVPELLKRCLYTQQMLQVNFEHDPLSAARAIYNDVEGHNLLDKLLYFDILSYAVDDLMIKVDRMTMAHGLIAYSPFHDRELVEFIAGVPTHLKINGQTRKYVMREALRPLLPSHTLHKKKKGFDMPLEKWLINKFSEWVKVILFDARTLNRGYFEKKFIKKMVEDFLAMKTDYASGSAATIISLITLELWHRLFMDE